MSDSLIITPTYNEKENIENTIFPLSEESYLPEAEKGVVTAPAHDAKIYNIIFALATVPPVLAALDSIGSGYETYAIIERGKTYNGIEKPNNQGKKTNYTEHLTLHFKVGDFSKGEQTLWH